MEARKQGVDAEVFAFSPDPAEGTHACARGADVRARTIRVRDPLVIADLILQAG